MNKTLAAAALSAFLTTGANDETAQPTAADECMDKVFTAIKTDLTAILNDVVTGMEAHYSEEQVNSLAFACEVMTESPVTEASKEYMDQDGYTLSVPEM